MKETVVTDILGNLFKELSMSGVAVPNSVRKDIEKVIEKVLDKYIFQEVDKNDFTNILKTAGYNGYDAFSVENNGILVMSEYGYMTEGSVTDNPEETSRIVECSGAEISLSEFTDDVLKNTEIVNDELGRCKQYIDDVKDDEIYSEIYRHIKNGACITSGYKKDLKEGDYIILLK